MSRINLKTQLFLILLVAILAFGFYRNLNTCDSSLELTEKKQCWEDLLENTLQKQGVETALDLVDRLYQSDTHFASDCHAYIHLVGEKAYQLYSKDNQVKLTSKTSACGYGFYHGFMETLLLAGEDIKKAGLFCKWAEKQVGGKNDVEGACFHGIGHGLSENHDKKYLTENELVDNPLLICEQIGSSEYMINRCASGVFNVLAINYLSSFLPLSKEDPLNFCKKLTKPYFKKPCFEEMNTMLISISGNDLQKASSYLEDIEDQYAISAMRGLSGVVGIGYQGDYTKQIKRCREVSNRYRLPCIEGFVGGLIEAETGSHEVKALAFCNNLELNGEERVSCYQEALRLLSLYLKDDKYKSVCEDERYKEYCV